MSRFELYGSVKCNTCEYYGKARLNEHMRCRYPDNIPRENFLGPVYMRRPEDINYTQKCAWFKSNKNRKEKEND
jgi:hypothetical protein